MHEALLLPSAHVSHWLTWLLYLPPVLIVAGSIVWHVIKERREDE
jgi:hypothetical protein